MSKHRVEKVALGDRHSQRSAHKYARSAVDQSPAVPPPAVSSPDRFSVDCPERQELLRAYETAVRAYYKAVAAIRKASVRAQAVAAARGAYLASEDARTALEKHERDHSCTP